ncbi:hypothetical protein AAF712_011644 [Marasmius tenuissimus]|uniref:Uncharacterized protein n=1 Tax=Marasmius tenuissimus TaxID=585030 RepID=A0ABR2ZKG6_9AGAR
MDHLKYGSNWFHDGTWNASSVGQTGTLSSSNDPNAAVTFDFPMPAVAFHYFGIPRSRGGLYGICIDCDPNKPIFQPINAFNATDDGKNPPVALFSKRFDEPTQHVITLRNQIDQRGVPKGNSQITIDRFVLEVVDDSLSITSLVPVTIQPSLAPFSTSDSNEIEPPIGAIVGGAIGGSLLTLIIILTVLYCWCRRKHQPVSSVHDNVGTDAIEAIFFTIVQLYALMHPSISKGEQPKAGESRHTPQQTPRRTSSSGSTSIMAYHRSRRREQRREIGAGRRPEQREVDAGPIPLEDEGFTLPPLYGQVFQAGSSSHLPSGQEPNIPSQTIPSVMPDTAK